MNATVILDKGGNVAYTNLDEISGKVSIRCGKSADVSSIVVKLEGESRTRLMSPGGGPNNDRPKPQLEYHKILYRVQTVFPPAEIVEGRNHTSGKGSYTLPPGTHEYPFKLKIPFNNSCMNDKSQMPTVSRSGGGLEMTKPPSRHVKKTLPPTLSGFPGEAEIRYFVKATINRQSFFKENPRAYTPFNFFPIEPPRPPSSGSEIYARQKHSFSAFPEGEPVKAKMRSMFSLKKEPASPTASADAPFVSVDARLPEPAILTCNQEVPLRLIVKRLNGHQGPLYLQSLQVSLIGNTKIRAHDVHRNESNSWIIMSESNMGILIGNPSDAAGTEIAIDDKMWRGRRLPSTVAPSFETCNISRHYQVDVRVGLGYGGNMSKDAKSQDIVLPLRLDTLVYSGIAPPAELLKAMAQSKANIPPLSSATPISPTPEKHKLETDQSGFGASQIPATPLGSPGPSAPAIPPRKGVNGVAAGSTAEPLTYDDAPPSYEDAVATDLQPVNAPRPEYAVPTAGEDEVLRRDEKKGWGG